MYWAQKEVQAAGFETTPFPNADHTHVILPLPAFRGDQINGGPELFQFLPHMHKGITVLGGILESHRIELQSTGATLVDYYFYEPLIAANARLTAEAAVHLAAARLPITIENAKVLVCGWGRIGQLLAHKLRAWRADVTVSARNPKDLAMIEALGFTAIPTGSWQDLSLYYIIYNTVPAQVFLPRHLESTAEGCLLIDLASTPGFAPCPGRTIITAPGLPGAYAPETAGRLIGRAILTLCHLERS